MLKEWNIYDFQFSPESRCPHDFLRLASLCFDAVSFEEWCVSDVNIGRKKLLLYLFSN